MKKGQLVRINVAKSFTKEFGGERKHPITTSYQNSLLEVPGFSKYSPEEWAQIQKIAPPNSPVMISGKHNVKKNRKYYYNPLKVNKLYVCIRSRTKFAEDGIAKTGFCLLLDTALGVLIYARREYLEVVDDS